MYTNYDISRRSCTPSRGVITATFRANFEGYSPPLSLSLCRIHRLIALIPRDRRSFVSCGTIPRAGTQLEEISFSFSFARLSRADFSRAPCPLERERERETRRWNHPLEYSLVGGELERVGSWREINDRGSVSMNAIDIRWIELRLIGANYQLVGIIVWSTRIDINLRSPYRSLIIRSFETLGSRNLAIFEFYREEEEEEKKSTEKLRGKLEEIGNNGVKSEIRDTPLSLPWRNYHLLDPSREIDYKEEEAEFETVVGKDTVKKNRRSGAFEEEWQNVHFGWIHRKDICHRLFTDSFLPGFPESEREVCSNLCWIDCLAEDNYSFFESQVSSSRSNIRKRRGTLSLNAHYTRGR